MNDTDEGMVVEDQSSKWERALFTLLYAFFFVSCVEHIFDFWDMRTMIYV